MLNRCYNLKALSLVNCIDCMIVYIVGFSTKSQFCNSAENMLITRCNRDLLKNLWYAMTLRFLPYFDKCDSCFIYLTLLVILLSIMDHNYHMAPNNRTLVWYYTLCAPILCAPGNLRTSTFRTCTLRAPVTPSVCDIRV